MGSHEAGPARTHMLLVTISSSLSLLDAFWLKPDLFSFRHKIEMMHLSVLPAVTCGIQTITKGRLCDFHQHFENTLYLLSPTGVVFFMKRLQFIAKMNIFTKILNFSVAAHWIAVLVLGWAQAEMFCSRTDCLATRCSLGRFLLHECALGIFWTQEALSCAVQGSWQTLQHAWISMCLPEFFLLYPMHSSKQEEIDSCFFLLAAGVINDRHVARWKVLNIIYSTMSIFFQHFHCELYSLCIRYFIIWKL